MNSKAIVWTRAALIALTLGAFGVVVWAQQPVSQSGSWTVTCSNCSGSGASDVDDSAFNLTSDSTAPAGFLFDDVTPDSVDEGDQGIGRMSANRIQYHIIRDGAAGAERGVSVTAANELLVELGAGAADIGNVNLEIGGTAITAGAGSVAATTIRMTLASDDPAVASLATIDNAYAEVATDYVTVRITDGSAYSSLSSDLTVGTAFGTTGPGILALYQDFDGAALATPTNVDTELEAVPLSASIKGVGYFMPVTEDGSATAQIRLWDGTDLALVDGSGNLQIANAALTALDVALNADESAFTYATTQVLAIGAVAESTTDTLADGTVGAPVMTLSRFLRTTPSGYGVGGGTPIQIVSNASAADDEDETAVCTADCTIYSITAFNHTAASAFFRCEADTAANTTPGSETRSANEPDLEIPGNTTGAGFTIDFPVGVSYATALTCWIVSEEASSGTTDIAADDVRVFITRVQ